MGALTDDVPGDTLRPVMGADALAKPAPPTRRLGGKLPRADVDAPPMAPRFHSPCCGLVGTDQTRCQERGSRTCCVLSGQNYVLAQMDTGRSRVLGYVRILQQRETRRVRFRRPRDPQRIAASSTAFHGVTRAPKTRT